MNIISITPFNFLNILAKIWNTTFAHFVTISPILQKLMFLCVCVCVCVFSPHMNKNQQKGSYTKIRQESNKKFKEREWERKFDSCQFCPILLKFPILKRRERVLYQSIQYFILIATNNSILTIFDQMKF